MTTATRDPSPCCAAATRWSAEHLNFYCTKCAKGCGNDYYLKHKPAPEFTVHALDPDYDGEPNPVARAILADRSRYGWGVYGRDRYNGPRAAYSSHSWPIDEDKARLLRLMFGKDLTIPERGAPEAREWNPYADLVQEMVRAGNRTDRAGYLLTLDRMRTVSGMANTRAPDAMATGLWDAARAVVDNRMAYTPNIGWYLEPSVQVFGDGTRILSVEALDRSGAIVDLYAWTGCVHKFKHSSGGNCYHIHTCELCGYRYDIDSGD